MNKALWGKLGQFKWALVAAIVVLLIAIFATWRPVKYPATRRMWSAAAKEQQLIVIMCTHM